VTLASWHHPAGEFEDLTISLRPAVPSTDQVLRDTQEISNTDVHRFKISNAKEPHKRLVGNLFRIGVSKEATNKAENAVIVGRVKIAHDACAEQRQIPLWKRDIH